jgi:uncharacterized protein YsxB (DUF464 family)
MVEITYHRKYNRLTAKGHAYSGEEGHDLVCAAVSALMLTMAANVNALSRQRSVREPGVHLAKGDAEVKCKPIRKMGNVVTLMFDTVGTGFQLLADQYPEYISYKVMQ